MSSKLVSSKVEAVFYDVEDDCSYIFSVLSDGQSAGFICDGELRVLEDHEEVLQKIATSELEKLAQLESIKEAVNARKAKDAREPARENAGANAEQAGQVGSGVPQP